MYKPAVVARPVDPTAVRRYRRSAVTRERATQGAKGNTYL
jgi:hypothetical protein